MQNVYRLFKQELGYINVTNQYIELSTRYIQMDHEEELKNGSTLKSLSNNVNLSVTEIPDKLSARVAGYYIAGIHSCIEVFLISFADQPGSPANATRDYKPEIDNRLHWTLGKIYAKIPEEVQELYEICNYYRLVRNRVVHARRNDATQEYKVAQNKAFQQKGKGICEKLNAPSDFDSLNFDDQVLFSRAAKKLVEHIMYDSKYDLMMIIESDFQTIQKMVKQYANNRTRMKEVIISYLSRYYVKLNVQEDEWEMAIRRIIGD